MLMKQRKVILMLMAAGALLLSGCQKDENGAGREIRFRADSNAGTRTSYSGQMTGNVERIDWSDGDLIRIYSDVSVNRNIADQHWSDYRIVGSSISADGAESHAKIDNLPGGNGLVWGAAGDYRFFAIYPNLACADGASGILSAAIPATQTAGDMSNAVMTACTSATSTTNYRGTDITLAFSPAFTAFEFTFNSDIPLEVSAFELNAEASAPALAGSYTVTYATDGTATYGCTAATGRKISTTFATPATIDATTPLTFTLFALPQDLTGLSLTFTVQGAGMSTPETRTLKLKYSSTASEHPGEYVPFAARKKHKILGTMQGTWCFRYITLTGEAIDWTEKDITLATNDLPQASQFLVTGAQNVYSDLHPTDAYKNYRQTWVVPAAGATVKFKIFSPVGGSYNVTPQGATGKFTVSGSLSGSIKELSEPGDTEVTLNITPNGAIAGDELWFTITVTNTAGETFNIDSETQLYDERGYHKFRIDDPVL